MDEDGYVLWDWLPVPVALGELLEDALTVPWPARLAWIVCGLLIALAAVLAGLFVAYS